MSKARTTVRRVAIGETAEGKPCVASDEAVAPIETPLMPGAQFFSLWGGDRVPSVPNDGAEPTFRSWFPPEGGFRFQLIELPPEGTGKAAEPPSPEEMKQALRETEERLPGLIRTMDPHKPGMHRTDTIDMIYVTEGASVLTLQTGEETRMRAGDAVVLNGQSHAWRNPHDAPCRLLTVSIGVKRES